MVDLNGADKEDKDEKVLPRSGRSLTTEPDLLHPSTMGEEVMRSQSKVALGDKVALKAVEELKARAKEGKKWKKTKGSRGIFRALWKRTVSSEREQKQKEIHKKRISRMSMSWLRTLIDYLVVAPLHLNPHFSEQTARRL